MKIETTLNIVLFAEPFIQILSQSIFFFLEKLTFWISEILKFSHLN